MSKLTQYFKDLRDIYNTGSAVKETSYYSAFEAMANLATKAAVEGNKLNVHAPLLQFSKAEIILQGRKLGVDYGMTVSCYQADERGRACGAWDACR